MSNKSQTAKLFPDISMFKCKAPTPPPFYCPIWRSQWEKSSYSQVFEVWEVFKGLGVDVGQTFCVPDLSGTRGQNAEKMLFFCKNGVGNLYGGRILVCDVTLCVQEKWNQGQRSSISPVSDGFNQRCLLERFPNPQDLLHLSNLDSDRMNLHNQGGLIKFFDYDGNSLKLHHFVPVVTLTVHLHPMTFHGVLRCLTKVK